MNKTAVKSKDVHGAQSCQRQSKLLLLVVVCLQGLQQRVGRARANLGSEHLENAVKGIKSTTIFEGLEN
jgi:hypothetical protein